MDKDKYRYFYFDSSKLELLHQTGDLQQWVNEYAEFHNTVSAVILHKGAYSMVSTQMCIDYQNKRGTILFFSQKNRKLLV